MGQRLDDCRNDILDTVRVQHAVSRLVVEFDYLLVEAKLALEAMSEALLAAKAKGYTYVVSPWVKEQIDTIENEEK